MGEMEKWRYVDSEPALDMSPSETGRVFTADLNAGYCRHSEGAFL